MKNIEYYKQRFYLFYNYLIERKGSAFLIEQTKEIVDLAYNKKDSRKLEKVDKELNVWLREMLIPTEREELLQLLKNELNEDSESDFINQINKIVSKGKICSKKEYEIVLQRIESIYNNKEKEIEVKELNRLLAEFHK